MKVYSSIMNNIRTKFAVFYILLVIIPFSVATLLISNALNKQEIINASDYVINNLKTISINVDEILRNVEFVYTPPLTNNEFIQAVKHLNQVDERQHYSDYKMLMDINDVLEETSLSNNYLDSIYLYDTNGNTFISTKGNDVTVINNPELEKMNWYTRFESIVSDDKWLITKSYDNKANLICSYRNIKDNQSQASIAVMSININEKIVTNIFSELRIKSSGYSFVADKNWNIISNKEEALTSDFIKTIAGKIPDKSKQGYFIFQINNQHTLAAYYTSDLTGFKYVAVAPVNEINTSSSIIRNYAIYIYIFMILIFIAAVFIIYAYFYTPIRKLFSAMKTLEKGDFGIRLNEMRKDEIGYINRNFNDMVHNLKKLVNENYINKLLKKDAQLKSIQSQLNEHFLYNTLDSIHWIAREYNIPQICDIIFSLSKFYRLSLSSGKDVISIFEVMEIINNYVFIQKVRMQESLNFECNVDNKIGEVKVLKYLFQPLVENAVVHGIEKKDGGGNVKVSFRVEDSFIKFEVEDNGAGIKKATLDNILWELSQDSDYFDDHFALRNINSQLKLFYGNEYSLHIDSTEGHGTRVWFHIPIKMEVRETNV